MFSFVYNHSNIRIIVFLVHQNELISSSPSKEAALLSHIFLVRNPCYWHETARDLDLCKTEVGANTTEMERGCYT